MRLMPTPEMRALFDEIKPYFDFTQKDNLRADTPDEIRNKVKRYDELSDVQWEQAQRAEGLPV